MLLFTLLAMGLAMIWYRRLQSRYLIASAVCLGLVGLTWIVERSIQTPRERVRASIVDMTSAFFVKDLSRTVGHVSDQAGDLKLLIGEAYNQIDVGDDVRLTDIQIEMLNQDSRSKTRFRVNGTFGFRGYAFREPTRWEGTWQLESGEWKLIDIVMLDPISGNVVSNFDEDRRILRSRYNN